MSRSESTGTGLPSRQSSELEDVASDSAAFRARFELGDRFAFEKIIGRGAMSIVVRAHDNLLNRAVAIKLLSEELIGHEEAQQIFLTEARSLATLSHPNLVSVHDITRVDGRVLLVLELVKGENLEHLVHDVGGLPLVEGLRACIQLVRVIKYMHDCGVVHRDLKPANVMVRNDGTLKLIDFGLARFFHELCVRSTRVRGTPAYMAPEQIAGGDITPAADIYALGVTMFEIFSGQLPFGNADQAYAHVHLQAPSLGDLVPGLPPALISAVDQCIEKDPGDRPINADVLLTALQELYQQAGGDEIETDVSALMSSEMVASSGLRRSTGRLSSVSAGLHVSPEVGDIDFDGANVNPPAGLLQKLTDPRVLLIAIVCLLAVAVVGLLLRDSGQSDSAVQTADASSVDAPAAADKASTTATTSAPAPAPAEPAPAVANAEPTAPAAEPIDTSDLALRAARLSTGVVMPAADGAVASAVALLFGHQAAAEIVEVSASEPPRRRADKKKRRDNKTDRKTTTTTTSSDSSAQGKPDETRPERDKSLMFAPEGGEPTKDGTDTKKRDDGFLPM